MTFATATSRIVYRTASLLAVLIVSASLGGCALTEKRAMSLKPGMSAGEVVATVGTPTERSFRGTDEAWQYQELVGFGQCAYMTAWLSDGKLVGVSSRRGFSAAGCGLGSRAVDWNQIPKPSPNSGE